MLLFPAPYVAAVAGGLIVSAATVFKSSATQQVFGVGQWNLPVVAGELACVEMHGLGNAVAMDPANFLLTLGGAAMTRVSASAAPGTAVFPASAHFWLIAPTTGTLELRADMAVASRAGVLVARRATGFNPTTPVSNPGAPSVLNNNTTSTLAGATIAAGAGSVIVGSAVTKAGNATAASSATFDATGFDTTGAVTTSDLGIAFSHKVMGAAADFTPQFTFDLPERMSGLFLEINRAP